ncbi:hypothetical protein D3C72_2252630 [compost metagenome]
MQVAQLQRHGRLLDKGRLFAHGVHTTHIHLWAADGKHHAGQTTARAHIEQAHSALALPRQHSDMAP